MGACSTLHICARACQQACGILEEAKKSSNSPRFLLCVRTHYGVCIHLKRRLFPSPPVRTPSVIASPHHNNQNNRSSRERASTREKVLPWGFPLSLPHQSLLSLSRVCVCVDGEKVSSFRHSCARVFVCRRSYPSWGWSPALLLIPPHLIHTRDQQSHTHTQLSPHSLVYSTYSV